MDWLDGGTKQEGRIVQISNAGMLKKMRKEYPELSPENRLSGTEQGQTTGGQHCYHLSPCVLIMEWVKDFTHLKGWHSGDMVVLEEASIWYISRKYSPKRIVHVNDHRCPWGSVHSENTQTLYLILDIPFNLCLAILTPTHLPHTHNTHTQNTTCSVHMHRVLILHFMFICICIFLLKIGLISTTVRCMQSR